MEPLKSDNTVVFFLSVTWIAKCKSFELDEAPCGGGRRRSSPVDTPRALLRVPSARATFSAAAFPGKKTIAKTIYKNVTVLLLFGRIMCPCPHFFVALPEIPPDRGRPRTRWPPPRAPRTTPGSPSASGTVAFSRRFRLDGLRNSRSPAPWTLSWRMFIEEKNPRRENVVPV